jgi:hypothetical protein
MNNLILKSPPGQSQSDFTVRLPETVRFDGCGWEVAVSSLSMSTRPLNFQDGDGFMFCVQAQKGTNKIEKYFLVVLGGGSILHPQEIIDLLYLEHPIMKTFVTLTHCKSTQRFRVQTKPRCEKYGKISKVIIGFTSKRVALMFGCPGHSYVLKNKLKQGCVFPYSTTLNDHWNTIIYCDLVESTQLGNVTAQHLGVFPRQKTWHKTIKTKHMRFVPVALRDFTSIRVQFRSASTGEVLRFDQHEPETVLRLCFRQHD